jgi:hypothetical protein
MRFLMILLLALAIPFNAAYAATVGICDTLDVPQTHDPHVGHHVHDHAHDAKDASSQDDTQKSTCSHNCPHAHALFSSMMPSPIRLSFPATSGARLPMADESFVSATLLRLEHPPKSVHVA